LALTREQMRAVIIEHVAAENDHDPARVIATYSRRAPVFEGRPSRAARGRGGDSSTTTTGASGTGFPDLQRGGSGHHMARCRGTAPLVFTSPACPAHPAPLHFVYYNFCRVHQTLKTTPAVASGLADHVWTIEELVGLLD
jgi:hypothetical protein